MPFNCRLFRVFLSLSGFSFLVGHLLQIFPVYGCFQCFVTLESVVTHGSKNPFTIEVAILYIVLSALHSCFKTVGCCPTGTKPVKSKLHPLLDSNDCRKSCCTPLHKWYLHVCTRCDRLPKTRWEHDGSWNQLGQYTAINLPEMGFEGIWFCWEHGLPKDTPQKVIEQIWPIIKRLKSAIYGALAQLGECVTGSHEVRGSTPLSSSYYWT